LGARPHRTKYSLVAHRDGSANVTGLVQAITLALLTAALSVGVTATSIDTNPANAQQTTAGCDQRNPTPPPISGTPVVFVHGWRSSGDASESAAMKLSAKLGAGFTVLRFDYGAQDSDWPSGSTANCLASYLVRVWEAAGRSRKVAVVAHSMGGIATRFAAAESADGTSVSQVLAGLVTLSTPHQGSPWGDTSLATAIQTYAPGAMPVAQTSAATCLADLTRRKNPPCATPPYLPAGVGIDQIGTQIIVKRTLFDIGFLKKEADIYLYGDGIVPQVSAEGYPTSVPHTRTPRAHISSKTFTCEYSTGYLLATRLGAKLGSGGGPAGTIIGGELGLLTSTSLDNAALDELLSGKASLKLAELTGYAALTPCFHTNMTTYDPVVDAAAAAVRKMDTKAATTRITNLQPVKGGIAAAGWMTIDQSAQLVDCTSSSPSAVSDGIMECSPSSADAGACWTVPEGFVLCVRDPWRKTLALIPATTTKPTVAPHDPAPLALGLADGSHCYLRLGGAWPARPEGPTFNGSYSCGEQPFTAVWGDIDKSGSTWTVHIGQETGPLRIVGVTEAFFAA
jgi:pimeloyl-ACP methyl ester carboxylesterase